MIQKTVFSLLGIILFTFFFAQGAIAQGITVQLLLSDLSSTTLFVNGYEGDTTMIRGFTTQSNILYEGTQVGTATSEIILSDPPFNPANTHSDFTFNTVFSFPGAGTLSLTGSGIVLVGITFSTTQELVFTYLARCTEGTDLLSDINCVGTGIDTGLGPTRGTLYVEFGSSGD